MVLPLQVWRRLREEGSQIVSSNSVLMDGADLWQILEGRVGLDDLMRSKVRRLAEEGRVFVPARELFP